MAEDFYHYTGQSRAYPGSPSPDSTQVSSGALAYPIVTYSASPSTASCGLSGCATSYSKSATISSETAGRASHLTIGFDPAYCVIAIVDLRPTAPPAIKYLLHEMAVCHTGIHCLSG